MFGRRPRETTILRVFEFSVAAGLAILATACSGSSKEDTSTSLDPDSPPLAAVYGDYFPIGAAVMAGEYGVSFTSKYDETTLSQFNSFVGENCMKPGVIQPTKDSFVWSYAGPLVAYAEDHGKTVRGHVLVWHSQTPNWMFDSSGTQIERRNMPAAKCSRISTRWSVDTRIRYTAGTSSTRQLTIPREVPFTASILPDSRRTETRRT